MISKSLKSSGIRRLGLQPLAPNDGQANQQHQQPQPQPGQAQQAQQQQPARAPAIVSARSSKAQALSAFRSLVEGSAVIRPSTAHANDHTTALAAAANHGRDQQQQQEGPAQINPPAGPSTAAGSRPSGDHNRQSTAPAPAQQTLSRPQVPGFPASTAPTAPAQAPAQLKGPPNQLIPKASKALDNLQQQLSSRTLTYLYQFDGLLSTASSALDALAGFLHSTSAHSSSTAVAPAQHGLQQLLQDQQQAAWDPGEQSAAVLDLLLQICMQTWVSYCCYCAASKLHCWGFCHWVADGFAHWFASVCTRV